MQVKGVVLLQLQKPLLPEPVGGAVWVAVEPELRLLHAAPGQRLFHKGPGHEGHLVQQHPRQGDALDEGVAGFILAAEEVKTVFPCPPPDGEDMPAPVVTEGKVLLQVSHGQQRRENVAFHAAHGLPADSESAAIETPHGPEDEAQAHDAGFARAHRAIADEGAVGCVGEAEYLSLLFREAHGSVPPSRPG